jgi:hypothetical protein
MKTMMDQLYNLYQKTLKSEIDDNSFRALSMEFLPHRVGCSNEGFPMLFIECCDKDHLSDIKLSMFRVLFNRKCSLADIDNKNVAEKDYSIIQMVSDDQDLIKYFFQVITIVLKRIPINPKVKTLKEEISKVIEIFTVPPKFSKEVVRGLWAELLVIERSSNPEYLVRAWHEEPEDRYDFNDSIDKIEVKSTSGDQRSHLFSLEQLNPNDSSNLIIASVFVNPSGIGKNIFDLMDMISPRLKDTDCSLKLSEIVLKTIGLHLEECRNLHFDYNFASDTLTYYDSKVIPSIDKNSIPSTVSAVHFRSDMSDVPSISVTGFDENSILFKSL